MSATPSVDDSFTFVGGLNSEGLYFLTPKNSWKEGDNVVPATDGSLSRRKAIDFEENYQTLTLSTLSVDEAIDNAAFTVEIWESVAGNGNLEFFVVQKGSTLYFYKAASGTVSASLLPFTVDLTPFKCFGNSNTVFGTNVITTASCYGKLLITSIDTEPILVFYNESDNTITTKQLELKIRDFVGIRSPAEPTVRNSQAGWESLSFWPQAKYNLYNQGWKDEQLTAYLGIKGVYPNNTEQWIYGKNTSDDFDTTVLDKQDFGTSPAPRGRVILKAFYQDRGVELTNLLDTTAIGSIVPPLSNYDDLQYIAN
jgi:hypothetical protein